MAYHSRGRILCATKCVYLFLVMGKRKTEFFNIEVGGGCKRISGDRGLLWFGLSTCSVAIGGLFGQEVDVLKSSW